MQFERTADLDLVRSIITHPKIYPHVSDDFSPGPEDYTPVDATGVWYVIARDQGELLGLWMVVWHSQILAEIHTCLLPCAWGQRAKTAAQEALGWLFASSGVERVITQVPESNKLAHRFARAAGMSAFGLNPKSFRKQGKLIDVILMGRSRGEQICQQQQ